MKEVKKVNKVRRVRLNDYELMETIGTGSFGRVRLCRKREDESYYAVKILKKIEILKSKQVDHMLNELQILS